MIVFQRLDLSYTYLTSLPDGILHTPKNLTQLDLSGNLFTVVPSQLSHAANLRYLSLNENPIVNITAEKYDISHRVVINKYTMKLFLAGFLF